MKIPATAPGSLLNFEQENTKEEVSLTHIFLQNFQFLLIRKDARIVQSSWDFFLLISF